MKNEQHQQAKNLYFQTGLNKTQIAEVLNISRRSLHYWIKEGNWDRLKRSAQHLPSLLAENCYHLIGQFTKQLLAEHRIVNPITRHEAETLHKLVLTVNKLKNRTTLNENMETFAHFLEKVNKKAPELVQQIMPHVDEYLSSRASIYQTDIMPENFNWQGLIPPEEKDMQEQRRDNDDLFVWNNQQYFAQKRQAENIAPIKSEAQPEVPLNEPAELSAENKQNLTGEPGDKPLSVTEEAELFMQLYPHLFQNPEDEINFITNSDICDGRKMPEAA